MKPADISLYITDQWGRELVRAGADTFRESSSTIKIPILLLSVRKMKQENNQLEDSLERLPRHNTNGSGVLNWTAAERFSFEELLFTTMVYSDCLATNVLLDYIGGKAAVNSWLEKSGMGTRLLMPYLYFDNQDGPMPEVGTTNAREMLKIFQLLDEEKLPSGLRGLVDRATGAIHESWLELSLPGPLPGLRHKTGSMINCGPDGDTVYNAAGSFRRQAVKYYFCLLARGQQKTQSDMQPDGLRRTAAGHLWQAIKKI